MEQPVRVEVSHTLSNDQLQQIAEQVYETTLTAIKEARKASHVDSDIIYSKNELRKYMNNISFEYLEELLADPTFPRGRVLSERKQCFSKTEVKRWLLNNNI